MKIKFIKDHTSPRAVEVKGKTETKHVPSGIKAGRVHETQNIGWAKRMIDGGFAEEVGESKTTSSVKSESDLLADIESADLETLTSIELPKNASKALKKAYADKEAELLA